MPLQGIYFDTVEFDTIELAMTTAPEALILDLLEWVVSRQRTYDETMNAWRTSCPRLPVWEDANDRGLIAIEQVHGRSLVRITASGMALLSERRPPAAVGE